MNRDQIFIFTGPTISPEVAEQHLDAIYLPPVRLGDVYRITELFEPRIIGIIDGYFNQVPAVWHKEILYAISQGISVFGAASMGALRAAELDQLGMIGCGEVYRAYQSGVLPPFNDEPFEDDDEVAVIHCPAELGYLAASDAMVNIRFTLAKAKLENVIDESTLQLLIGIAKKLFYAERNYSSILDIAQKQGLSDAEARVIREWIKQHSVDQKQLDAIALLEIIDASSKAYNISPASTNTPFKHTSQWQSAVDEIDHSHHIESPALNELKLKGDEYFQALERALESSLPLKDQQNIENWNDLTRLHKSPDNLQQRFSEFWQRKQNGLTAEPLSEMQCDQILLAYLQQSGKLESLEARAKDKQTKLQQLNQVPDSNALNSLDRLQLCDWYFSTQLGVEIPDQAGDYAVELGFRDTDSFYDMILKEYIYLEQP
jgi:hypothetical protein